MRGADRDRSWAGWLGAALSLACGRSGLELDDLGASNESGGRAGSAGRGGAANLGGTRAGGAGGTGGTGGTAGDTNGGSAGSDMGCAAGEPTWSCAPAVVTGECCDANGPREPQCRDVCVPDGEPQGLACERPGETSEQPVVTGISRHCEGILFACYVQKCTCGCREGAIATVPGLRETCAPTLFQNALHFPHEIVLDDEFVYWTVGGSCPASGFATGKVMGARRTDGSAAFAILDQPCPRSLAEDGEDLFWTAGDSIRSARKGDGRVKVVFAGQDDLSEVRADDEHVYWRGNRTISRQRRDQSGPFEIFTSAEYRENSSGIVDFELDDRYVYWLERGHFESHVYRADKADSSRGPESLASIGRPVKLAISSEGLFWASELTYPSVGIWALRWENLVPTLLIERPGDVVTALGAFADEAFWVEGEYDAPGFVYGIRAGESEPSLTIGDQNRPVAVAADEQYVFWMNQNYPEVAGHAGEIMRVCLP